MSSYSALTYTPPAAQDSYSLDILQRGGGSSDQMTRSSSTRRASFTMRIDAYMEQSKIVGLLSEPSSNSGDAVSSVISSRRPGHIVVLQGAMSSAKLRDLVGQCDADCGELLQLHFASSAVFPIGRLSSRHKAVASIRFITLGSFMQGRENDANDGVRSRVNTELAKHHRACLDGDRDGYECFRVITMHGRSFFTVEQQASFFTYETTSEAAGGDADTHAGCWSGVLLSDVGKFNAMPPWNTSRPDFDEARFLSVGSSNTDSARFKDRAVGDQIMERPNPFESRRRDDTAMSTDEGQLCKQEPFVFAADLFETSALCWNQVLNFLRDLVQNHLPDEEAERVQVLGEAKALVDRASRYFDETIRFIDTRGDIRWPIWSPGVAEMASRLRCDFDALRSDAAALSTVCQDAINMTMNNISARTAQQALVEGKRIHVVTYLAFVFIPVSLVATVFGMNVAELDPPPAISWFFVSAVITSAVCLALPVWLIEFRGTVRLKRWLRHLRD